MRGFAKSGKENIRFDLRNQKEDEDVGARVKYRRLLNECCRKGVEGRLARCSATGFIDLNFCLPELNMFLSELIHVVLIRP